MSSNWRTNQMYTLGITNVFGIEGLELIHKGLPAAACLWTCGTSTRVGIWDHSAHEQIRSS